MRLIKLYEILFIFFMCEPVGDEAVRRLLPPKGENDESIPVDIVYDEENEIEYLQNPFDPPQCPLKSSAQRNLLAEAGDAAHKLGQIPSDFTGILFPTTGKFNAEEYNKFVARYGSTTLYAPQHSDGPNEEVAQHSLPEPLIDDPDGPIKEVVIPDDVGDVAHWEDVAAAAQQAHRSFEDIDRQLKDGNPEAEGNPEADSNPEQQLINYAQWIHDNHISVIPNDGTSGFGSKRDVLVVGDPHGAASEVVAILKHAGMIDPISLQWIGRNHIVIVMGDLIHRGAYSAWLVYMVFYVWQPSAPRYGSNLLVLFGNHEFEQFWFEFGNIANYGYEGGPFYVPDQAQIDFLQHPIILYIIKQNSFMMVKVGSNLITHSGFDLTEMDNFFQNIDIDISVGGNELIPMLNEQARRLSIAYPNEKLGEIANLLRQKGIPVDTSTGRGPRLIIDGLRSLPQSDKLGLAILELSAHVSLGKMVNGRFIQNALEFVGEQQALNEAIAEFSEPLLKKFGCIATLWSLFWSSHNGQSPNGSIC